MASAMDEDVDGCQGDQGFISAFNSLPQKQPTTIRFFDQNDYYKVYDTDAKFIAKELFKTVAVMKHFFSGAQKMCYVNVSKMNFESFIKELLLVRGYCVEVYKNIASGKSTEFKLLTKASPGNLGKLEELLFGSGDASEAKGVIAVKLKSASKQLNVGVAYGDAVMRQFYVAEFCDDNHFTNLQALLIQLGPKECLFPTKDQSPHLPSLKEVMERSHILVSECKQSSFGTKDLVQDLNRLLKFRKGEQNQSDVLPEFELSLAMAGIAAVINYLELMSNEGNFGQFSLKRFNLEQFMKLDCAAVKALALLPVENEVNKNHSILGLLNKCRTTAGQRLLTDWLKQPLMDINKINERLNIVEAFVQNTELRQTLFEDNLRKIPDLYKLSKKLQAKKANLQDCYRIYQMLENLPKLRETLETYRGPQEFQFSECFCGPIKNLEDDFVKFQEMVKTTIDLDQVDSGEFLVRADFDQDLQDLQENMETVESQMKSDLKKVSNDLGLEIDKVLKLETASQHGWHYRVTKKGEQALRSKKEYTILSTQNKGILFHSKNLKNLNQEYQGFKSDYQEQQKSVINMIMEIASGYSDPINSLNDILAFLDTTVALSVVAVTAPHPYVKPKLEAKGTGKIMMSGVRHPLVEIQENIDFIANSVSLDQEDSSFHIITGPNMGGKSTYIRSVALNVLLAQIGSFVACEEATISVVDSILTRVGAGDRQLQGVSTFMSEMLETAHILRSATKDSLIIIDELGRGTSTYDGFGLAWSISEHIVKEIGAFCLFATHFHELTSLSTLYKTVKNLHVSALTTSDTLTLLYKVKPGVCDQSFGIHVAELANFPKEIIQLAKEKVAEFEDFQGIIFTNEEAEPDIKRKKTDSPDTIISEFLNKVKEIPVDSLTDTEVVARLEDLKLELKESGNKEVSEIIAKISGSN